MLVDWKAEELKAPTVITGRASIIEYAESCCDGLDYEEPRVGQVVWDEYGNYLGQIGDDREVFLPIPSEFLFDSGLHYGNGEGIPPHLLRDAGLGWWLDEDQAEDDEKDADSDPPAVSSGAFGSDIASWVEDTDMSGVDRDDDTAEENNEADNRMTTAWISTTMATWTEPWTTWKITSPKWKWQRQQLPIRPRTTRPRRVTRTLRNPSTSSVGCRENFET